MARRIRSETDGDEKKRARKRAEKHFNGGGKEASGETGGEQRVLPALGHNGPTPATLMHHIQSLRGFKAKVDEANGRLRNAWKQAEEAGINRKAMKLFFDLEKIDPDEASARMKALKSLLDAGGIEVQMEMFEPQGALSKGAAAYDGGYKAGIAAKNLDSNPYTPNTEDGQLWMQGWHAGQAKNFSGIKQSGPEPKDDGDDEAAAASDAGADIDGDEPWPPIAA